MARLSASRSIPLPGSRVLTRVHVGDIELGQREILDSGGGDDFGFHNLVSFSWRWRGGLVPPSADGLRLVGLV